MSSRKARSRDRARPSRHSVGRRSILVVDDEPGTVEVLVAVLQDAGFDATGVTNGRDVIATLAGAAFDLVLLDFVMPTPDGADTLVALRKLSRFSHLAVVMMSGVPESMVKRRCRGYAAFLRKPFFLADLLAAVRRALEET